MRLIFLLCAALPVLAACTGGSATPTVSAVDASSPAAMPQPANSLPPGDVVNAPVLAPGAGVATTPTAPRRVR